MKTLSVNIGEYNRLLDSGKNRERGKKTTQVKKCSFKGCKNDRKTTSLYQIPKKGELRQKWLELVDAIERSRADLHICASHFSKTDFKGIFILKFDLF